MSNIFPRGSEWRKWDLHIHTPETKINDQYQVRAPDTDVWKKFIETLENSDVMAFGITDYFSIDSYTVLLQQISDKGSEILKHKVIFPNIEFRLNISTNRDNDVINAHVIFDNAASVVSKIPNFLTVLKLVNKKGDDTPYHCTAADMCQLGYENATVTLEEILEALKETYGKENPYLILVAANGYGGMRPDNQSPRKMHISDEIDKKCDMFFGRAQDKDYFLKEDRYEDKSQKSLPKPVVAGSDCHSFEDCVQFLGKHHKNADTGEIEKDITWVKADLTFEGLKQLVYEPDLRVKIQEKTPNEEYKKPFFSKIIVLPSKIFAKSKPAFQQCDIEINRDLVTIIGGRGTGKSLLIESLAKTFHQSPGFNDRLSKINPLLPFSCKLAKSDDTTILFELPNENNFDYLHVHQEQVKQIVKDVDGLDAEIKKLIGINEPGAFLAKDEDTKKYIYNIFEVAGWLEETDEDGNLVNTKEYQESLKKKYNDLIGTITTKNNQENIEKYRHNTSLVNFIEEKLEVLSALKSSLERGQSDLNQEIFNTVNASETVDINDRLNDFIAKNQGRFYYNHETYTLYTFSAITEQERDELLGIYLGDEGSLTQISQLYEKSQYLKFAIPTIDFSGQLEKIKELIAALKTDKQGLEAENEKIKEAFLVSGIEGDVSTLLDKVDQYQGAINTIDLDIQNIDVQQKRSATAFTEIFKLPTTFKLEWDRQKQAMEGQWDKVKNGDATRSPIQNELIKTLLADININASVDFNEEKFYAEITDCINGNKFKTSAGQAFTDRVKQILNVKDLDSYIDLIQNKEVVEANGKKKITLQEFISDSSCFVKNADQEFMQKLYLSKYIRNYVKVTSKSTYKSKAPSELSVGQRGTFYICLKLATDSFSTPFVFDQPEDDLDNDFIMKELVPIFKEIKKYRQVIIVTHNANLVVNADAEQIIVAHNQDESISYTSGALENREIRESVYNILEGGHDAFRKREQKYDFKFS